MATTAEIMVGGILLMVYWFTIGVFYFIENAVLGPILDFAAKFPMAPVLQQGIWQISYIPAWVFACLALLGIIGTIGFVMILARNQVTPYDY